jgi:sulfide dehydrogenase cytochrome subunit
MTFPLRFVILLLLGSAWPVAGPIALAAAPAPQGVVAMCAACHGRDGVSKEPTTPIIGGQARTFLVYALKAFAAGDWPSPVMGSIAKTLSEEQIQAAADYYSRQRFVPQKQKVDPALAEEGREIHARLCGKCHVDGGRKPDEYEAILVGQWMPHLRKVLGQYRHGDRAAEKMMLVKLSKLNAQQVESLINYYGRGE